LKLGDSLDVLAVTGTKGESRFKDILHTRPLGGGKVGMKAPRVVLFGD